MIPQQTAAESAPPPITLATLAAARPDSPEPTSGASNHTAADPLDDDLYANLAHTD